MLTPPITLTTDFGLSDSYVAQMKGVILGLHPQASIVDATHLVSPQDVLAGALVLNDLAAAYPPGTIHVAVVDPGVGSSRRIVAAEIGTQRFVAPDNGLLGIVSEHHRVHRVFELRDAHYWRAEPTSTFHGRDIMAPVAAHWSLGVDPARFGPASDVPPASVATPPVRHQGDAVFGEVISVDHFGNLITNIPDEKRFHEQHAQIVVCDRVIGGLQRCYSDVPPGELLALIGSAGRLEISQNAGSAAQELHLGRGATVVVKFSDGARADAPA